MSTRILYKFRAFSRPFSMVDCDELTPVIESLLPDWGLTLYQGLDAPIVDISLRRGSKGFIRESKWLGKKRRTFSDPVAAVCDLIVDLVHAYVEDHPHLLCLHSAAVEVNGNLILFPSTYRAGKSTLTAKLVSCGGRAFTDDVVPIDKVTGEAIALGVPTRLRLPIPENSDIEFRQFVENQAGPKSKRYLYLERDTDSLAYFAERKAINSIVVLQRTEGVTPRLVEANKGEILRDLILRNFARQGMAIEILDLLQGLVEEKRCYRMEYDTLEQASNLLMNTFHYESKEETRMCQ